MDMNKGGAGKTMTPIYDTAAETLRRRILRGRYRPGTRLPTERELCGDLRVSRITVRRALQILEEERLIDRRQGSGTYVAPHPTLKIPLMIDYTGSMRRHAPGLRRRVLFVRCERPPDDVRRELGLAPDATVLHARRRDRRGRVTVAMDETFISAAFSRRLKASDLAHVDFVEDWTRKEDFRVARVAQRVEAVAATREWAALLAVAEGSPLLRTIETYRTHSGAVCGLFVSYYVPEHIMLVSEWRWGTARHPHGRSGTTMKSVKQSRRGAQA